MTQLLTLVLVGDLGIVRSVTGDCVGHRLPTSIGEKHVVEALDETVLLPDFDVAKVVAGIVVYHLPVEAVLARILQWEQIYYVSLVSQFILARLI